MAWPVASGLWLLPLAATANQNHAEHPHHRVECQFIYVVHVCVLFMYMCVTQSSSSKKNAAKDMEEFSQDGKTSGTSVLRPTQRSSNPMDALVNQVTFVIVLHHFVSVSCA